MRKVALKIDPLLNVPLSRQLAEALRTAIIRRRFKPGDVLPTAVGVVELQFARRAPASSRPARREGS